MTTKDLGFILVVYAIGILEGMIFCGLLFGGKI